MQHLAEKVLGEGHLLASSTVTGPSAAEAAIGKTDLLLRFFDSQFFDEWVCLTYLYKSNSEGVQDYLCNRLYSLPESGVELYLLQLVHLVLTRPHSPLERVLVDLCARSLRLAVKVFWLVLARTQDHPGDKYAVEFRDACERAAVEGHWEPPFKNPKLMPLSPIRSNMFTPPMSPNSSIMDSFSPRSLSASRPRRRRNSADGYLAEASGRCLSPMQPRTPEYGGGQSASGQVMGLEGLLYGSPNNLSPTRPRGRLEVGSGNSEPPWTAGWRLEDACGSGGVAPSALGALRDTAGMAGEPELLSPPSSPRQRFHTFGATLDFIEALCLASSGLTAFPHDERQSALVRALEDISSAIESASRSGIAIWSPVGTSDERIVRLAARESNLLASRERAPFVLYVEVLQAVDPPPESKTADPGRTTAGAPQPTRQPTAMAAGSKLPAPQSPLGHYGGGRGSEVGDQNHDSVPLADSLAQLSGSGAKAPELLERSSRLHPRHLRTVSAAEEAGGSGEDPFRGVQLPPGRRPRMSHHNRSSSTLPSPTAQRTPPGRDAHRRTLSFEGALQPLPDSEAREGSPHSGTLAGRESLCAVQNAADDVLSSSEEHSPQSTTGITGVADSPFAKAATKAAKAALDTSQAEGNRGSSSSSSSRSGGNGRNDAEKLRRSPSEYGQQSYVSGSHNVLPCRRGTLALAIPVLDQPLPISSPEELLSPHQRQRRMLRERSLQMRQPSQQFPGSVDALNVGGNRAQGQSQGQPIARPADSTQPHPRVLPRRNPALEPAAARPLPGPFATGLSVAMEGLGGDGPVIRLNLRVHNDVDVISASSPTTSASSASTTATVRRYSDTDSSSSAPHQPAGVPLRFSDARGTQHPSPQQQPPRTLPTDSHPLHSGLLCKFGMCRGCNAKVEAARLAAAAAAAAPRVEVEIQVHGGVDLRLSQPKTSQGHHRWSSAEALSFVAASHQGQLPHEIVAALGPDLKQQALVRQQLAAAAPSKRASWRSFAPPLASRPPSAKSDPPAVSSADALVRPSAPQGSENREPEGPPGHLISRSPNAKQPLTAQPKPKVMAPMSIQGALTATLDRAPAGIPILSRRSVVSGQGTAAPPAEAPHVTAARRAERRAAAAAIYGERFQDRAARVKAQSPHGRRPGWALRPVMVKSGDDCRQESLAMQLISTFDSLFHEESLPLWLRPYEVLVTSDRTALIEFVPNTASIHAIKSKSPPGSTLRDHYLACFGPLGTPEWSAAQRAFVESMAAYSIVSYILQIKDRHNGNILVDEAGHLVHIDFGFMLSNSPGGVNFEAAPFKLTRDLLQIMDSDADGRASQLFDYFKVLCIRGFLAARKHADRVMLLVEMMDGAAFPCFKAGPKTLSALRKRFAQHLTEPQVVEHVLGLISESLDSWRTRQYDIYQRLLNGIA